MNYAIVEDGTVTNIIWLYPTTAFENAVPCGDYPVAIGDTYTNGRFYRDGELVLSPVEEVEQASAEELAALIEEIYTEDLEVIG